MEVTIGDYGRMMFQMMVGEQSHMPEHWASIKAEAEPLVRQLLALNGKMVGGGYKVVGYVENGKNVLSSHDRITEARRHKLGTLTKNLAEGDLVWLVNDDIDFEDLMIDPVKVEIIDKRGRVFVEHPMDRHGVYRITGKIVLKAPADWNDKMDEYQSPEYWLKVADQLGI